jgi:hypothetical protein
MTFAIFRCRKKLYFALGNGLINQICMCKSGWDIPREGRKNLPRKYCNLTGNLDEKWRFSKEA